MKNELLRILNDLNSAGRVKNEGQGGSKDEEEGGTRRKEARVGRRDEENEKMNKLLKRMKNEKVAEGRIIGLAGPCLFLNDGGLNNWCSMSFPPVF